MKNEDKLIMSKKVNLASPKAGAKIIDVSDDFFAKCDRMLNDTDPFSLTINMMIMENGWMVGKAVEKE